MLSGVSQSFQINKQDEILTLNEKSLSALERNLEKTVVTVKMMKVRV